MGVFLSCALLVFPQVSLDWEVLSRVSALSLCCAVSVFVDGIVKFCESLPMFA